MLSMSVARDFSDIAVTRLSVGVDKAINENISLGINAERTFSGDNTSTQINAGLNWKF